MFYAYRFVDLSYGVACLVRRSYRLCVVHTPFKLLQPSFLNLLRLILDTLRAEQVSCSSVEGLPAYALALSCEQKLLRHLLLPID